MDFSYLYILTDGENIKVGISNSISKRIKQLQTGHPKIISVVSSYKIFFKDRFSFEARCHGKLSTLFQKRGEWFCNANQTAVKFIVDNLYLDYQDSHFPK